MKQKNTIERLSYSESKILGKEILFVTAFGSIFHMKKHYLQLKRQCLIESNNRNSYQIQKKGLTHKTKYNHWSTKYKPSGLGYYYSDHLS